MMRTDGRERFGDGWDGGIFEGGGAACLMTAQGGQGRTKHRAMDDDSRNCSAIGQYRSGERRDEKATYHNGW
jgi:hypothetical protein